MERIDFYISNTKLKWYKMIAFFFLAFNFFAFVLLLFYPQYRHPAIWAIGILCFSLFFKWIWAKMKTQRQWIDESVYFTSAVCWMTFLFFIPAIICLIMGILFLISKKDIHFVMDQNGVTKQNFPSKFYPWTAFSNIILKDGLLTLDFANNHFIQIEVKEFKSISESDFNKIVGEKIQESIASI